MLYKVYLLTNKHNNKRYVGVTNNLTQRMRVHKHYAVNDKKPAPCVALARATRKYGWGSFELSILAETDDPNTAWNILEPKYITEYQSNNPEYGYNLTQGGEGISGRKMSPLSKQRMRDNHWSKRKTIEHPMCGRNHTTEARQSVGSKNAKYQWICISPQHERYETTTIGMFAEQHNLNLDTIWHFSNKGIVPSPKRITQAKNTRHNTTGWSFSRNIKT